MFSVCVIISIDEVMYSNTFYATENLILSSSLFDLIRGHAATIHIHVNTSQ